ncbi:sortase [Streptomyces sp. ID05-26A]|nr:sortase [Streptomyces sp. ID05-26A]
MVLRTVLAALTALVLLSGCASPPEPTLPTGPAPVTSTSTSDSAAPEQGMPASEPAVLLGHVDGNGQPGVFFRLRELTEGDEVEVSRKDGTTAKFRVRRTEQIAKNDFPTEAVYGDTDEPELRLITCGGSYDRAARSYRDNIIVYATSS